MRQRWREVINLLFVLALVMAAIGIGLDARAQAHDNCNGHSCNDGGGGDNVLDNVIDINVAGGDMMGGDVIGGTTSVVTGNNKSLVVAPPGLGDVDIAQCLGSQAWTLLIGGKQTLVLNQVCMAEFYLKQGRYDLAAQSLCNQGEILKEYETEVACEIDHDFTPAIVEGFTDEITETFEDEQQIQDNEIEFVQMAQTDIYERIEALEQKPAPRPRVVQAPPTKRGDLLTDREKMDILGMLSYQDDDDER